MEQPAAGAVEVKRSLDDFFSKTVILVKKKDCLRRNSKVHVPKNVLWYKTNVQFSEEMSEDTVRAKLQETFPTFSLNGR